jgi:hypothetical protein
MKSLKAWTVKPLRRIPSQTLINALAFETRTERTSDGREPRVVPTTYNAVINKPVELTLGEQGVDKVKAASGWYQHVGKGNHDEIT